MRSLQRFAIAGITVLLLSTWCAPSFADEGPVAEILKNAVYGGVTGGLLGTALLAFTHKPSDHLDYIAVGAAVGVFAGASFGAYKSTRALAEVENGKVRLGMPTIMPDYIPAGARGEGSVMLTAEVIRGKF